uniref:G-protein coupled receptors family 1 profile domain-containing protein n=1 Tax=Mola mola TaxID=94237 RepID=A0A3Q3VY51_MOLML
MDTQISEFLTSPSPSPLHCDYSDWSPSFSIIPSVYLLAFLIGCLGNSLVTLTVLASLALADLFFLATLPLWAVYTAMGYHWPFGQPLCQISSFLTALNMYASVFSLSMLSVERYWVLTGHRPSSHHAPQRCPSRALWILGGVWLLAGLLALPGLLLRSLEPVDPADSGSTVLSCQMDYSMLIGTELEETDRERAEMWWAAALSLKSTLIAFLLPLVILLICYCSLAQLLSKHFGRGPRPDRRRQRRLLRVIVTLVMAFFLCWLPLHVNKTVSTLLEFGFVPYSCSLDQLLLAAQPYVTCLAYLNSCLNPLLYAACDPSFRKRCRGAIVVLCRVSRRRAEGRERNTDEGEEEREERSSAFPTGTQEETADKTAERVGEVGRIISEAM